MFFYFYLFPGFVLRLRASSRAPLRLQLPVFIENKSQIGLFTLAALMWCDCLSLYLCAGLEWSRTMDCGALYSGSLWLCLKLFYCTVCTNLESV